MSFETGTQQDAVTLPIGHRERTGSGLVRVRGGRVGVLVMRLARGVVVLVMGLAWGVVVLVMWLAGGMVVLMMWLAGGVIVLMGVLMVLVREHPHLAVLLHAFDQELQGVSGHFVHADPVLLGDPEFGQAQNQSVALVIHTTLQPVTGAAEPMRAWCLLTSAESPVAGPVVPRIG